MPEFDRFGRPCGRLGGPVHRLHLFTRQPERMKDKPQFTPMDVAPQKQAMKKPRRRPFLLRLQPCAVGLFEQGAVRRGVLARAVSKPSMRHQLRRGADKDNLCLFKNRISDDKRGHNTVGNLPLFLPQVEQELTKLWIDSQTAARDLSGPPQTDHSDRQPWPWRWSPAMSPKPTRNRPPCMELPVLRTQSREDISCSSSLIKSFNSGKPACSAFRHSARNSSSLNVRCISSRISGGVG